MELNGLNVQFKMERKVREKDRQISGWKSESTTVATDCNYQYGQVSDLLCLTASGLA
jgi:hypothetical protein